jgi:hypothetical protein
MKRFERILTIGFLIILSLTPLIWFIGKRGILINGVDTNFPLDPAIWFARRFFAWQAVNNLGSDFSAGSAGLFFHFIQFLPFRLGFALQSVEIFSLVFWFFLIVFSTWFFARLILPNKRLPQIVFVTLFTLNIYMFNSWENVKVANLALVAAIPMGLSILLLLRENKIKRSTSYLFAMFTGIVLSGAGINPAYIICFFLILFIFVLAEVLNDFRDKRLVIERIKDFLFIGIFITLANLFWILPTINFIFGTITSNNSIGSLGFTNWVDSLSQNTSLVNVTRMMGAWDWYSLDSTTNLPLYIPYATRYFFNPFFIAFSFIIPSIAFIAFSLKRKIVNFLYLVFAILLVIGIFLTSGTHPPTGDLFAFFARHIPFFSLFRSPWYIFAPLVGLSIAGLVSMFFYELENRFSKRKVAQTLSVVFVVCMLIYSYPLVLGKIFRPNFNGTFYLKFPDYVFQTHDWLIKTPARGRILSYPDDNIEKFKWGYSGVDSILGLMSDREVVDASLNDTTSPFALSVSEFYNSAKKGESIKAKNLADKFGVGQIFYKKDEVSLTTVLPDSMSSSKAINFGEWSFYNFPSDEKPTPKIYATTCCFLSYPNSDSALNLTLLNRNQSLINPNDSILKNTNLVTTSGAIIHSTNSQLTDFTTMDSGTSYLKSRLLFRDLGTVQFDFNAVQSGIYKPVLQKYGIDDFGVINQNSINLQLDGKNQTWNILKMDDSYLYFSPINITSGKHSVIITLKNRNAIDINNFTKVGDGSFDYADGVFTMLNKSNKDIYFQFPIMRFDPSAYYLIALSYKQTYGNNAQVLMDQRSHSTLFKEQTQSMPDYPEWIPFSFYYHPIQTQSDFTIGLEAPQTKDVLGTKVSYKDVAVYKVFTNDLFFEKDAENNLSTPNVSFKENSPITYSGEVMDVNSSHVILFNESYSPQWQLHLEGAQNAKATHFTINSFANAWYIEGAPGDYKFTITYKPQSLLKVGYILTGISVLAVLSYYIYEKRYKQFKK